MSGTPQRSKRPPIQPVWVITAAISTVVLLLLTAWRMLVPPPVLPPPEPAARQRAVADAAPTRPSDEPPSVDRAAPTKRHAPADASRGAAGSADHLTLSAAPRASNDVKTDAKARRDASQANAPTPPTKAVIAPILAKDGSQPPHVAESASPPAAAKETDASQTIVDALEAKTKSGPPRPAQATDEAKKTAAADGAAQERIWLAAAKQFAARHQGRLLEARAFPAGELTLPGAFDATQTDVTFWFLGGGQLETNTGVYAFGLGYEQALPVMRQELPQLAAELGLVSAGVELRHRGNDLVIRATATAKPTGPEAIAEKRNEINRLQNRRDRLNYQLREWQKVENAGDSAEAKAQQAAVREALLKVLQTPAQPPPQRPSADEPRKTTNSAAAKPQPQPDETVTARDRMLYRPETLARNELVRLDVQIRQLQAECNAALARSDDAGDRAVERFQEGCRRITVVIYQSVKALPEPVGAAEVAPPPRPGPAPQPLAAQPPRRAEADAATPADLKPTVDVPQWPVTYRAEIADGQFAPTDTDAAQLTVQALAASGSALPKWFHDEFSVYCTVCEFAAQGKPHVRDLTDAGKPRTCNVSADTTQLAVRFWVTRKSAAAGGSGRPVAETPWHVVASVRRGDVYRVKAPLTSQMLLSLQAKPGKPPPATRSGSGKKSPQPRSRTPH